MCLRTKYFMCFVRLKHSSHTMEKEAQAKKHRKLDLNTKLKILDAKRDCKTMTNVELGRKFDVSGQSIKNILNEEEKIRRIWADRSRAS